MDRTRSRTSTRSLPTSVRIQASNRSPVLGTGPESMMLLWSSICFRRRASSSKHGLPHYCSSTSWRSSTRCFRRFSVSRPWAFRISPPHIQDLFPFSIGSKSIPSSTERIWINMRESGFTSCLGQLSTDRNPCSAWYKTCQCQSQLPASLYVFRVFAWCFVMLDVCSSCRFHICRVSNSCHWCNLSDICNPTILNIHWCIQCKVCNL